MTTSGGGGTTTIGKILLELTGGGSPSDAPGGGGDPTGASQGQDNRADKAEAKKSTGKIKDAVEGMDKKTGGYVRNTLGINIGVAAILKQSQIFTGTLGTIFQILGAMVDVILAPFMPLIVKGLQMLVSHMPGIQEKAQRIIGNIIKVAFWIGNLIKTVKDLLPVKIGNFFKSALQYVIIGLFLAKLFGLFGLVTGAVKVMSGLILKSLGTLIYGQRVQIMQSDVVTRQTTGNFGRGGGIGMGRAMAGGVALAGAAMLYSGAKQGNVGQAMLGGATTGAGVGAMVGGPMGAVVGGAIGLVAGGIIAAAIGKKEEEISSSRLNPDNFNPNGTFLGTANNGRLSMMNEVNG
jgi:hypothetical protein